MFGSVTRRASGLENCLSSNFQSFPRRAWIPRHSCGVHRK